MAKQSPRAVFDSLLAKTHVQHALVQPDGRHNEFPAVLATLFFLDATPDRLQATFKSMKGDLGPWEPSPRSISDDETKARFLGDGRFQRAFMTYFSMENGRFAGNTKALAMTHLFTGGRPLICGLFSGVGRPLTLLSDGIELRAAIMVMESLTLSAVDWTEPMRELLLHPQLSLSPPAEYLSPEDIIGRVAYDGRFSGVMKAGPGFHSVAHVFSSAAARGAIAEYLWCLDTRDVALVVQQLAALSVLLAAATHKPGLPAFDLYLGRLPTCVNSARVILENWVEEESHRVLLVRGVFLLVMLTYITQLRPVVDGRLLATKELAEEGRGWEVVYEKARRQAKGEGGYENVQFARALRTLAELSAVYSGVHGRLYFHGCWKLVGQWRGWTGLGIDREVMLNIRL